MKRKKVRKAEESNYKTQNQPFTVTLCSLSSHVQHSPNYKEPLNLHICELLGNVELLGKTLQTLLFCLCSPKRNWKT